MTEESLSVPGILVRELRRIAQMNPAEYDSNEERSWAASACSAAAMTVVMNGYTPDPYRYRVVDILREEIRVGAISQAQGLLSGLNGIKETVHAFGFDAKSASSTTVEGIISLANAGTPLIVSFPPQRAWPAGHLLVLTGGNENTVFLLDSSEFNLSQISRSKFLEYWAPRRFAVQLIPRMSRVLGKPSLSVQFMDRVLSEASSPAEGKAQALYDLGVEYGIDPAFALAFFEHESSFGTQGVARTTLSLSNMRCIPQYACHQENGGYARFSTWEDGFRAWYVLICDLYIKTWKRVTVEQIIPKYAPNSDNNNETAYIQSVLSSLQKWRNAQE